MNLTQKQFLNRRLACEQGLITIYARITILKLFQHWPEEKMKRIPFESFAENSELVPTKTYIHHEQMFKQ